MFGGGKNKLSSLTKTGKVEKEGRLRNASRSTGIPLKRGQTGVTEKSYRHPRFNSTDMSFLGEFRLKCELAFSYFNEKFGLQLELGGGNRFGDGKFGISIRL